MGKWYEFDPIGLFDLLNKGETEGSIQKTSTLSPEQQKLIDALSPYLQQSIGKGLPAYTGEMVAGMSPAETQTQSLLNNYLTNTPDIQTFGLDKYKNALEGMNPEQTAQWYNTYVMPEQKRIQEEQVIPGIREAYAGPTSAYYSEPRMGAEARSWNQFGTTQQSNLGEAIMNERQSARNLLPYLPQMSGMEGGLPQIEAGAKYGALPRVLQQADLASKFEEFKRTTPELSPIIDQIMQLLNTTTTAAYNQPYQPSPFMQLLTATAPIIGAATRDAA